MPARSRSASWRRTGSAAPRTARRRSASAIDIRMVAPMNAGPLFFIVRAEFADPVGRRSARPACRARPREERHGAARPHDLRRAGLSFSEFTPVYLDFPAGAQALARGEVDAQFQCPIPNKVMTALSEQRRRPRAAVSAGPARERARRGLVLSAHGDAQGRVPRHRCRRAAGRGGQYPGDACARARGDRAGRRRGDPCEHGRTRPAQSAVLRPWPTCSSR